MCGSGENEYKRVVTIEYDRYESKSKIVTKQISHHPYVTVIAPSDTSY